MIELIRLVGLRHWVHKRLRSTLTALGIAVGIALFASIVLINQATLRGFKDNVTALSGQADLVISAGRAGFDEQQLIQIENMPGIKNTVPIVEEMARVLKPDGTSESLVILGVDLLRETAVRNYKMSDTANEELMEDPLIFLNQPDSVILTREMAKRLDLKINSKFRLSTARGVKIFTVRGLMELEGAARAYGGGIAIMDLDATRFVFGRENNIDRADIVIRNKSETERIATHLRKLLGPSFQVQPPQSFSAEKLLGVYQVVLILIGSMAFVVSLMLVMNTAQISVLERRREIGILRSLGAERHKILLLFVIEAALLGLISSCIGASVGGALAHQLVGTVSESLSAQSMMKIPPPRIDFRWADYLFFVGFGTLATTLSALWPAFKAQHVAPIEAIKKTHDGASHTRYFRWLNWLPGIINRMAQDNLQRNLKRTLSNVISLALGLSLVIVISSINSSFRQSIGDWLERVLRADLIISTAGPIFSLQTQPLHEDLKNQLSEFEPVKDQLASPIYGMRFLQITHEDRTIALKAFDNPGAETGYSFFDLEKSAALEAGMQLFSETGDVVRVAVSTSFSDHFKKQKGDTIQIATPRGGISALIIAVATDYGSNEGVIYFDRKVYKKYWNDPLLNIFYVRLKPSADAAAIRYAIENNLPGSEQLQIMLNREMKNEFRQHIDKTFSYSKAVEAAALICALISMVNLLFISIVERTREIGLLRAIGLSRSQTFQMVLVEALIQGLLAAVFAILWGAFFTYVWIYFIMTKLMGWSIDFYFESQTVWVAIALSLTVSLVAGLWPAYRASHIKIKEALAYE